jgi:hypothetical protein
MDRPKLNTTIKSCQCVHNCVAFPTCHQVVSQKTNFFLLLKLVPERTLLQLLMKATAYIRVDADIYLHAYVSMQTSVYIRSGTRWTKGNNS